ncbi:Initiator methionine tRNA 2'-O-ribosyl phosphate transferase [Taphrina deformans PYCC 5710]|uniref:Initiator methionine tRNA 2'-O-ribosyl phosphate transferase n=1 Tax=Taphrina deformans (strain PYCC 5710 / ATCC 11124 / CBS 356.35 / IMI 108563 / JCM 9778 / NBRC 8474) TaxID=1097556 RepID=R4XAN3_TAPDE|nr:Initiator methionine tRNA 2'-O-ribosyl phosphate transferase [Taphrina deformans PYCC 5710]|eukprot:CCG82858.1 Initiator methionine tRNA 2'-O-ribosyl phosphate transferase [Taphrina deformans PYCC 5710]
MLDKDWNESQLALHTPLQMVSKVEKHQITAQLQSWVHSLLATGVDRDILAQLNKPLRPIWITPESSLSYDYNRFEDADFYPLILVTASRCVPDGVERQRGFVYVQGAADDEEMWSGGLKPESFWAAPEQYLHFDPASFGQSSLKLRNISEDANKTRDIESDRIIRVRRTSIYLSNQVRVQDLQHYNIIDLSLIAQLNAERPRYRHFPIEDGKRGISGLCKAFAAMENEVDIEESEQLRLLITDDQNCQTKAAVIALLILALYYDAEDTIQKRGTRINKDIVKNRLVTLVNCRPGLNPSRAALKSLNEYLMSDLYKPLPREVSSSATQD